LGSDFGCQFLHYDVTIRWLKYIRRRVLTREYLPLIYFCRGFPYDSFAAGMGETPFPTCPPF
jgi:hypothetical protein